ncbi:MAG: hypothetical protein GVY36_07350 [Verrucomicrobia bacterium]|jgi:hypothetical protein|nr:hypothetical protein [Verrucomicrobiota bacterium]
MNKSDFFERLLSALQEELDGAVKASRDAAEYATNEESRAESQWDTQGLEASYLAAGQAGQARQWAVAINDLRSRRESLLQSKDRIAHGALFSCDFGDAPEYFFFAGVAGGQTVDIEGITVTVITQQSPLIARLRGLKVGESFRLPNGSIGQVLTVA